MDDLISEFITETTESIGLLDSELVRLEQNPNDQAILGNIFRLVHTIKGTCGFLGLPRLASVAHAGENVLGKIRDGEIIVSPQAISIVLEALDTIKGLIEYLSEHGREPAGDDTDLIARLNAFAESAGAVAPAVAEPEPAMNLPPVTQASPFSQEEMDALERAFAEASPTIGGIDFSKAPDMVFDDEMQAEPAAPAPIAAPVITEAPAAKAPALAPHVQAEALKQGLDTAAKDSSAGAANQSIRVNLDVLENLMQMVGELVLTRNQLLQVTRHREERELSAPLQQLSQITSELQDGIMKTRMQPISSAWSKFPRLIRDLSLELNKKIDLKMIGDTTEVDRQILEAIKDPLTHMVRNSCDHGLEGPADRSANGKSETGTVTLSASHEGGYIIIEIADDGRGINLDRVKQKALENGIATEEHMALMSDEQIMQFIFKAGFSTAEKVTSVSGRGVGMDVVRTNIEKIGGAVTLRSTPGKGSTFHIKIPLTLAIVSVLIVESRGRRFAIPQLNVSELVSVAEESDYKIETIHGARVLRLREKLLALLSLGDALHMPASEAESADTYVAIVKVGSHEFGLLVDRIHDTEEIVVKPISRVLENLPIYAGNTILGDGSVIMILDPNGLAKELGGEETTPKGQATHHDHTQRARSSTYLLFTTGTGTQKAVPLELVSRLEEIKVSQVELSSGEPVVQYRGDLMQIKRLDGSPLPQEGVMNIVVFSYDNRSVGLMVDKIVDIVQAPTDIKIASEDPLYLGGMVIADKSTDVIDVAHLIQTSLMQNIPGNAPAISGIDSLRLLYVEDSPFFRNLSVNYFKGLGLNVTAVGSGQEGLQTLQAGAGLFDVIVTDIEMPEMNGFEFARNAKQIAGYNAVPIYAFTSTVNQDVLDQAKNAQMLEVINKTNRDALISSLQRYATQLRKAA